MGSDRKLQQPPGCQTISIHAPRVGSDEVNARPGCLAIISIHAPRVGSDGVDTANAVAVVEFQSTLPVWGATWLWVVSFHSTSKFQSTLPVWGATMNGI